jgi:type IX secretion system PorP/SprF family membrane protein
MKHVTKIIFVFVVAFLSLSDVVAQQDAQFSQYMFNGLFYNPGNAGIEGVTRATVITRRQWLGYTRSDNYVSPGGNTPTSQAITINSRLPFLKNRTGAGLGIVYDNRGPITSYEIQLSGAYLLKLGNGNLGIGARAGTYAQSLRTDWYQVVDQTDPIYQDLVGNSARQLKMDYAAGLWYQATKWYMGFSLNHLSKQKFSYGSDSITSVLNNHMHINGGYIFQLSPTLKIIPSAIIQTDLKQMTILVGPMIDYNSKFWIGANVRQSAGKKDITSGGGSTYSVNDIIGYVGMNMLKNNALRVGFAFDAVLSGRKALAGTSHEVMLSYMIPSPGGKIKPKVRTPRYRHDEN